MDSTFELLLVVAAGMAALATVVVVACRKAARGMWAAGYWWSEHDRSRGPGC